MKDDTTVSKTTASWVHIWIRHPGIMGIQTVDTYDLDMRFDFLFYLFFCLLDMKQQSLLEFIKIMLALIENNKVTKTCSFQSSTVQS